MKTVEFQTTFGDDNVLNVIANVTAGRPAKTNCLPEDATPAEGPEVEIIDCRLVDESTGAAGVPFIAAGVQTNKQLTSHSFSNLLRVLLNIDYHDLDSIITRREWDEFKNNPWRWMIATDSRRAAKVFQLMMRRANWGPVDLEAEIEESAVQAAADSWADVA